MSDLAIKFEMVTTSSIVYCLGANELYKSRRQTQEQQQTSNDDDYTH